MAAVLALVAACLITTGVEPSAQQPVPSATSDERPRLTVSIEAIFSWRINGATGPRWFSLLTRQGNGPGGRFWNAGAATERIAHWKSLSLGGEIEVWQQPSFGTGAGVHAHLSVSAGWVKGLQIYGGAKSDGDWPGRPARGGGFFRVGYRPTRR